MGLTGNSGTKGNSRADQQNPWNQTLHKEMLKHWKRQRLRLGNQTPCAVLRHWMAISIYYFSSRTGINHLDSSRNGKGAEGAVKSSSWQSQVSPQEKFTPGRPTEPALWLWQAKTIPITKEAGTSWHIVTVKERTLQIKESVTWLVQRI